MSDDMIGRRSMSDDVIGRRSMFVGRLLSSSLCVQFAL